MNAMVVAFALTRWLMGTKRRQAVQRVKDALIGVVIARILLDDAAHKAAQAMQSLNSVLKDMQDEESAEFERIAHDIEGGTE